MDPPISNQSPRDPASTPPAARPRGGTDRATPNGLEQRLLERARRQGFARAAGIIVGFSGGRDSLALAAALRRARDVLGIELLLVHVDHGLRQSSAADAIAAMKLAETLGIAAEISRMTAPPTNTHPGVGMEEAARRERYRLLFAIAAARNAAAVATAHHQADQAETVLLHLLRGSGIHGAAAMAERAPAPLWEAEAESDISRKIAEPWLWRPFLSEPRGEIEASVLRLGLHPIEDPSNDDISLRRNALRHRIMPSLEEQAPGAVAALCRYASLAAEDDQILEEIAARELPSILDPGGRLIAARLAQQPLALQRRIIRQWLTQSTGMRFLTAERTDAIVHLAVSGHGGRRVEIGEGWTVECKRGMLIADQRTTESIRRDA